MTDKRPSFPPSLDALIRNPDPAPLVQALREIAIAHAAQVFPLSESQWRRWMIVAGAANAAAEQLAAHADPSA